MSLNVYSSQVGVAIQEVDKHNYINPKSIPATFFAGYFERGTCNELLEINSKDDLKNILGNQFSKNFNDWQQTFNFLTYANNLKVARAVGKDARNSIGEYPIRNPYVTSPDLVLNINDFENKRDSLAVAYGNRLKFLAKDPGVWGDDLSIMMINHSDFVDNVIVFQTRVDGVLLSSNIDNVVGNTVSVKAQSVFADIPIGAYGLFVFFKGVPVEVFVVALEETSPIFIEKVNYSSKYILIKSVKESGHMDGYYKIYDGNRVYYEQDSNISLIFDFDNPVAELTTSDLSISPAQILSIEKLSDTQFSVNLQTTVTSILDFYVSVNPAFGSFKTSSKSVLDGNTDVRDHAIYKQDAVVVDFSFYGQSVINLRGGVLAEPAISDLENCYEIVRQKEVEIDYILGNEQIPEFIKGIADSRQDVIAFLGAPRFYGENADKIAQTIAFRNNLGDSDFCYLISNYKKTYNSLTGVYDFSNLAGDVCGLRVKTDTEFNKWTASAGQTRGILQGGILEFFPTKNQIDDMYIKGINSFTKDSTKHTVLFGNKIMTLKSSAMNRLTTRNLSNYIIRNLEKISRKTIFEQLDNFLINNIDSTVRRFLDDVKFGRGISNYSLNVSIDKIQQRVIIDVAFASTTISDLIQINFVNVGESSFSSIRG